MKHLAIPAAVLLLAGGCASKARMVEVMAPWEGAPMAEVIAAWGYPDQQFTIHDRRVFAWTRDAHLSEPSFTTGSVSSYGTFDAVTTGGGSSRYYCTRYLEFDENDVVAGWSFKGNVCGNSWRRNWIRPPAQ